jgi:D-methionine transport system permease protein
LIGYSAMSGVIGGGGLGDLAVRYGYQRFDTEVMLVTVAILVLIVQIVQWSGDRLIARLAHR